MSLRNAALSLAALVLLAILGAAFRGQPQSCDPRAALPWHRCAP